MQLQEDHQGVVCISANLDHNNPNSPPSEDLKKNVLELLDGGEPLAGQKITCENVIVAEGHDQAVSKLGITNGLPAVLIYDKEGKLYIARDAGFEYDEHVVPVVVELLKKKS